MAKIFIEGMPDAYCLAFIAKYHKNKIKSNGIHDPYLTTRALKKSLL